MRIRQAAMGVAHPHQNNTHGSNKYQSHKSETINNNNSQPPKEPDCIEFHSRFVQKQLSKSIREHRGRGSLAVKSDMNSGKTHAIAHEVHHNQHKHEVSILITPYANLTKSAEKATQRKFNSFAKKDGGKAKIAINYTDLTSGNINDADLITTTTNSLPKAFKLVDECGAKVNMLVIDESESVAQFMATGTITNKSEAAETITKIAKLAKNTIMLDAHLGNKSLIFFNTFIGGNLTILKNTRTVWSDYTFSIYKGRDTGTKLTLQKVKENKNLFITSTTASQAEKIDFILKEQGLTGDNDILAAYRTSDDAPESPELKAAKANPKLFLQYKNAIPSPASGTGLSIEEDAEAIANNNEHFNSVISFMTRDKNAPDAYSALQMPFRIRSVKEKHIDIVEIDNIHRGAPESEFENKRDAKKILELKKMIINHAGINDDAKTDLLNKLAETHINYEAEIYAQNTKDFYNFFDIIRDELKQKGMTEINPQKIKEDDDLKELKKDVKRKIEERNNKGVINAKTITEEQANDIRRRESDYEKRVTADEIFSLRRYNVIKAYHHNENEPSQEEVKNYLALEKKGIAKGRNNIVLSQLKLKDINAITRAYTKGVGDNELFIKDIADNSAVEIKAKWELFRVLTDIAGVDVVDGAYTLIEPEKTIDKKALTKDKQWCKRDSYLQALLKQADNWNATKPESRLNKKKLREKPVETVRKLIELHLKIDTNKQDLRGINAFKISEQQPAIDNANLQAGRGSFSYIRLVDRIRAHEAIDENLEFKEGVAKRLGITEQYQQHIAKCLEQIPHRRHIEVIAEYLKIASCDRKKGDRFTPAANANGYILKQAGLKNSGVFGGKKQ